MRHFGKLWNNYTRPKFQYVIREFKILQNMAYVQNGVGYAFKWCLDKGLITNPTYIK